MAWKPLTRPEVDVASLPLDARQREVAQKLDGTVDEEEVALLTGFRRAEVKEILDTLVVTGVIDAPEAGEARGAGLIAPPAPARAHEEPPPEPMQASGEEPLGEVEDQADAGPEAPDNPTHRQLFETVLRHLTQSEREARAQACEEPELSAFAFDPLPAVIARLFENPKAGLTQARLVARHHQNPVGLEQVVKRGAFASDQGVRRALLQNPQLTPSMYTRLWGGQRLLLQYKNAVSRDLAERTRRFARDTLRQRFTSAQAEDRVDLIFKTEGRCLTMLIGMSVDSKTVSLMCHRTYASTILVQNIGRWASAPPAVIAHLLKQDLVRRNPQLRTILERHPNAPRGH